MEKKSNANVAPFPVYYFKIYIYWFDKDVQFLKVMF